MEETQAIRNAADTCLDDDSLVELGLVRLPKDRNGETIHIGDELYGYGYPEGGVYCKAIVNERTILVGEDDEAYGDWLMWDAGDCARVKPKPTVREVLHAFINDSYDAMRTGYIEALDEVYAKYEGKLREVMGDEE